MTHIESTTITDVETSYAISYETTIVSTATSRISPPLQSTSFKYLRHRGEALAPLLEQYPADSIFSACGCFTFPKCHQKGTTTLAAPTILSIASTFTLTASTSTITSTFLTTTTEATTLTSSATTTTVVSAPPPLQTTFRMLTVDLAGNCLYLHRTLIPDLYDSDSFLMPDSSPANTAKFTLHLDTNTLSFADSPLYAQHGSGWYRTSDSHNLILFNALPIDDRAAYQFNVRQDDGKILVGNADLSVRIRLELCEEDGIVLLKGNNQGVNPASSCYEVGLWAEFVVGWGGWF